MSKLKNFKDVFEIVKLSALCEKFTSLNARGGIYHRIKGYNTDGKAGGLKDDEKRELCAGLRRLAAELLSVAGAEEKTLPKPAADGI